MSPTDVPPRRRLELRPCVLKPRASAVRFSCANYTFVLEESTDSRSVTVQQWQRSHVSSVADAPGPLVEDRSLAALRWSCEDPYLTMCW